LISKDKAIIIFAMTFLKRNRNVSLFSAAKLSSAKRRLPWVNLLLLVLVMGIGFTLRIAYLYELQERPQFQVPLYFQTDMGFIDNSALDWATAAREYCGLPPIEPRFERFLVWRHRYSDALMRPPGYMVFLSSLYFFFGDSQFAVRLVQMLLGMGSVLLGYRVGKQLYSRNTGLLMAVCLSFYWPFIIYEASLHEPVLVIFMSLLFMSGALWWAQRPGWLRSLWMGFLCGLYTVCSSAIILFLPVLVAWSVWVLGRYKKRKSAAVPVSDFDNTADGDTNEGHCPEQIAPPSKKPSWFLLFSIGNVVLIIFAFFIPLLPIALFNYNTSGHFVINSFGHGITLYLGNQPDSKGLLSSSEKLLDAYLGDEHKDLRVDEKMVQIDDFWALSDFALHKALQQMFAHPKWFITLTLKRAALFWSPKEISQNITEYADRLFSDVLYYVPGNFAFVYAFFLVGLLYYFAVFFKMISLRRAHVFTRDPWDTTRATEGYTLLLLLILVWYGPICFLWISAHYRAPILPALFAFAALAFCRLEYYFRTRSFFMCIMGAVIVFHVGVIGYLIPFSYDDDIQTWLYFREQYYEKEGESEKILALAEQVVDRAPNHLYSRQVYAYSLYKCGHFEQALVEYEKILPRLTEPYQVASVAETVGLLRRDQGDNEGAKQAFLQCIYNDSRRALAFHGLGNIAFESGDYSDAIHYLKQALVLDESNSNTYFLLGLSYKNSGDIKAAEEIFRQGTIINPEDPWPLIALADLLSETGSVEEACPLYEKAMLLSPENAAFREAYEKYCLQREAPNPADN
jgi:4-amino-4-deoxy-L-arabinose transferase-like glycosyltransferase/Tfp pilus assembly protein PilF